jgi:hypothetical protein
LLSLIVAWVLFPLIFVGVCAGLGLLVERASGALLPGVLILPLGAAGLITASQLTTYFDWTAELTTPLVLVLAIAGLVLGYARLRGLAPDWWATAAAVGVFAILAAPVVLSGEATFAGYTVLGDTSIQMIGADQLPETGRDFDSLAPSSYEMSLVRYYDDSAYPSGGPTALAALRPLVFEDVAWIYQPFLACLVAMLALAIYSLAGIVISWPLLRGLTAFVAAQPALVVGYALQGSIKEVGIVFVVTLIGALVSPFVRFPTEGYRRGVPIVVAGAAAIALVGPAAAVWLAPFALALVVIALRRAPKARKELVGAEVAAMGALLAVLAYPSMLQVGRFLDADTFLTSQQEFGNLLGALEPIQMFGIWLSGDYRRPPTGSGLTVTHVLIAIVIGSMALGVLWAIRRRARELLLYFAVSFLAWAYVMRQGSPWADGKALMIVSPAVVLAAMLGPAALAAWGRRIPALIISATIAGGVLVSSAYAYHDVSLAPRDRLGELEQIGARISGKGPTLYSEFEEFGKHFLRKGAPEGTSEGWQRRYGPFVTGHQYPNFGGLYDIDDLELSYVLSYNTLVLRRSPVASRPPSSFRRTFHGRYYEVWQKVPGAYRILEHVRLGGGLGTQRGSKPDCAPVRRFANLALRANGRYAYVSAARSLVLFPTRTAFPPNWYVDSTDKLSLRPRGPGKVVGSVVVSRPGAYDVWIRGSFGRGVGVSVAGDHVGSVGHEVNGRGTYEKAGTVELAVGRNVIELDRGGGDLSPGDGMGELLGPVVLAPSASDDAESTVRYLQPRSYETLCRRNLDWIEVVRD